jgi:hypothetical protein
MPLNCDVLPLNIKGASRFLRKWPSATLDIEPPEALWPETKGQAATLARARGHPLRASGDHEREGRRAIRQGDERSTAATPGQPTCLLSGFIGHDLSDSQADSADSIPVTRSPTEKHSYSKSLQQPAIF